MKTREEIKHASGDSQWSVRYDFEHRAYNIRAQTQHKHRAHKHRDYSPHQMHFMDIEPANCGLWKYDFKFRFHTCNCHLNVTLK